MPKPKANLIAATWLTYLDKVVPNGAPPIQIQESKRAFFGGVTALLGIMQTIGERDDIDEESGAKILGLIDDECRQFVADVVAGKE